MYLPSSARQLLVVGLVSCAGSSGQSAEDGSWYNWRDLMLLLMVPIFTLGLNEANLGMSLSWLYRGYE